MISTPRHPARSLGLPAFSLLSVLVLLALACFPVLAHADSSGYQYETAVPSPTGAGHPATPKSNGNPGAKASQGGDSNPSGGGKSHNSESGSSPGAGGGNGNSSTGGGEGGGKGGQGNGSTKQPVGAEGQGGSNSGGLSEASSDDGGGSSPVIPILIAVLVLAAISIGIVVMRQRRQPKGPDSGSQVSPKASS